jgi:hypothetical protein
MVNSKNEALIFESLKEFYLSEIKKAGSFYSTSKKLGKSHNYIHEIVSKPKSIETLREVYFLIYPERKKFDKKKSS